MNEKFISLKKRYEELTKAKTPGPNSTERDQEIKQKLDNQSKRTSAQSRNAMTLPDIPVDERNLPSQRMQAGEEPPLFNKPQGSNYNPWMQGTNRTPNKQTEAVPDVVQSDVTDTEISNYLAREKARGAALREATERGTRPEPQQRIGRGYDEDARTMSALGAPRKWQGSTSAEIQTRATDFSEKGQERRAKFQEKADAAEAANVDRYGPLADTASKKSPRTEPRAIDDSVKSFLGEIERSKRFPEHQAQQYLMSQLTHLHHRISDANPLSSIDEQRADRERHHGAMAAIDAEKRQERKAAFADTATKFKHGEAIGQAGGQAIIAKPNKPATAGMSQEKIKETYPELNQIAEMAQTPEYQNLAEQFPTGASNIKSSSRINRMLTGGENHPSHWLNVNNSVEQMANSHEIANLRRKPVDRMRSITPTTDKTSVESINFPNRGKDLFFHEHAHPSLDPEKYASSVEKEDPAIVANAHAEKKQLADALGKVHSSLRDALLAHSNNKMDEHNFHVNEARMAANQVKNLLHNNTAEAQDSYEWLKGLPESIQSATNLPQSATQENQYTYRDAMRMLKDKTGAHLVNLQSIGPAFKEEHVRRRAALTPENIRALSQEKPDEPVQQTPQEYLQSHPDQPSSRQAEMAHPEVYTHPVTDPDQFHQNLDEYLIPSQDDNSLTSEMKNFISANTLRRYTHPQEFKDKAIDPLSDEFLGSVPITQLHNYFDPKDKTKLAGMPARQFAENVSQHILHQGMTHLNPAEQQEFARLNQLYEDGSSKMTEQEKQKHSDLLTQITNNGIHELTKNHRLTDVGNHALKAARFIAASRQQRRDYLGPNSSSDIVKQANALAQNEAGPDLKPKLEELRNKLRHEPWNPMTWNNGQFRVNPNQVPRSSWFTMKAKQHIDQLIRNAITQHKTKLGKSMATGHESLKKCRDLLSKAKEKLNKAIIPQGKYVRAPDGSLVLVDLHSQAVQQQQKDIAKEQQKAPKVAPAVTLAQPKTPTQELPAIPKAPAQPQPVAPKAPPKAMPAPQKPPAPKQPLPEPPKPSLGQKPAESIGDVARKLKAENAMSVFGYTPKKQ